MAPSLLASNGGPASDLRVRAELDSDRGLELMSDVNKAAACLKGMSGTNGGRGSVVSCNSMGDGGGFARTNGGGPGGGAGSSSSTAVLIGGPGNGPPASVLEGGGGGGGFVRAGIGPGRGSCMCLGGGVLCLSGIEAPGGGGLMRGGGFGSRPAAIDGPAPASGVVGGGSKKAGGKTLLGGAEVRGGGRVGAGSNAS